VRELCSCAVYGKIVRRTWKKMLFLGDSWLLSSHQSKTFSFSILYAVVFYFFDVRL